ncbi:archaeosortase/exosortase family protein [Flavobacteriales bacterium]|nr:archaeosortase/exosortase family protein [Flavobacteriales bacterium]
MDFKKPEFRFLISFIPLIILWFFFYHYLYKIDNILNINYSLLTYFSRILSCQSNFILSIFNLNTSIEIHGDMVVAKILDYPYSHGVWIGEPCNGIKIFGLFTIFILSFRGEIKNKLFFIPIGLTLLHILNVLRIAVLTYISAVNPLILDFNHNITFQLIIYGAMLSLWYIWITQISLKENK